MKNVLLNTWIKLPDKEQKLRVLNKIKILTGLEFRAHGSVKNAYYVFIGNIHISYVREDYIQRDLNLNSINKVFDTHKEITEDRINELLIEAGHGELDKEARLKACRNIVL